MIQAQKIELFSKIGSGSVFFKRLQGHSALDAGTKVLLLERALTQNSQEFEKTLDALYHVLSKGPQKLESKTTLVLLYGLKLINDLSFNNCPKYTHGDTVCNFHFSNFGQVDVESIQRSVNNLVKDHVAQLTKKYGIVAINQQKSAYQSAEAEKPSNATWRSADNLFRESMVLAFMDSEASLGFFNLNNTFAVTAHPYTPLRGAQG